MFEGLPSSIKIGPFNIAVVIKDKVDDDDSSGEYKHGVSIDLRKDQYGSPTFAVDTVIHEIGHGIYRTFGLDKKSSEESIVTAMSTGWVMVLHANPSLLKWICDTLQRDSGE